MTGSSWLKYFGHSNSLCVRAIRAIMNHVLIDEYRLRLFSQESFNCPCDLYPIKTRQYILHKCRRYNEYWNPRRDTISHFILFLEFNPNAFAFANSIRCYGMPWALTILFYFIFSDFTLLLLFFLFWRMMKRHVTMKSHDRSHDVMSQA